MTPTQTERASFANAAEVDTFAEVLARFERGEIGAEAWRAFRTGRGVYGQRRDGVHMLRIKLPQGVVSARGLRVLAEVMTRYSRGVGHLTTRQDVQLYCVHQEDLVPAMRRLAEAGITTSGAGGNAVRNVVSCPYSGVSPTEVFDVTPYAEAFTRHFLRHPLGGDLPRKFKVAFEGCHEDHMATPIHDLGFRAKVQHGPDGTRLGFSVTAAGGTSAACASGMHLFDFLPAGEVLALGEAVVRVFHARGDRVDKKRNRLKFLVRELGTDAFRALVATELGRVRAEGVAVLRFDPDSPPHAPGRAHRIAASPADLPVLTPGAPEGGPDQPPPSELGGVLLANALASFGLTNVKVQRQPGFSVVIVSLPGGAVSAAHLAALAELSETFGDGTVRFDCSGHALLRWIPSTTVPLVHARLTGAGLGSDGAGGPADVVACPGADACRLALTGTRSLARSVVDAVRRDLPSAAIAARLHVGVSGCPNGCSRHHIAAIGLQGSLRRADGKVVPQSLVLLGGHLDAGGATFGRVAAKVPARHTGEAVRRLVELYLAERRDGELAGPFFVRVFDRAAGLLAPLEMLRPDEIAQEETENPGGPDVLRPPLDGGECGA